MNFHTVWRIGVSAPAYSADDLSGEGAKKTGGRWNKKGTSVVYASESIALACLETLVHINFDDLPLNRYLVQIDIPTEVWAAAKKVTPKTAGTGWDALPAGMVSINYGDAWCCSNASAVLLVPSVVISHEFNVLINPLHQDARLIRAKKVEAFHYDSRLLKNNQT